MCVIESHICRSEENITEESAAICREGHFCYDMFIFGKKNLMLNIFCMKTLVLNSHSTHAETGMRLLL